jgi:curved DNA-binding protein CbpA
MTEHDPFAILSMAPSADLVAIKRAYFAALVRCPPHGDAEAFRRVREAYETLSDPRARTLALLRSPVDASAELAAFEAEWGERLAQAASHARAEQRSEAAVEVFVERISRLTFAEAQSTELGRGG